MWLLHVFNVGIYMMLNVGIYVTTIATAAAAVGCFQLLFLETKSVEDLVAISNQRQNSSRKLGKVACIVFATMAMLALCWPRLRSKSAREPHFANLYTEACI